MTVYSKCTKGETTQHLVKVIQAFYAISELEFIVFFSLNVVSTETYSSSTTTTALLKSS